MSDERGRSGGFRVGKIVHKGITFHIDRSIHLGLKFSYGRRSFKEFLPRDPQSSGSRRTRDVSERH